MSLGRPAVAGSFQRLERSLRREHPCPHLDLSLLAPEPEDSKYLFSGKFAVICYSSPGTLMWGGGKGCEKVYLPNLGGWGRSRGLGEGPSWGGGGWLRPAFPQQLLGTRVPQNPAPSWVQSPLAGELTADQASWARRTGWALLPLPSQGPSPWPPLDRLVPR